jgi:hypothetical protein
VPLSAAPEQIDPFWFGCSNSVRFLSRKVALFLTRWGRAGSETRALQPDIDHRSQGRSNVFLSASLLIGGVPLPVRVRNMSRHGALLDGGSLPQEGVRVRLVRGELSAEGEIAWQREGHAGIRFSGEIDVSAWVKKVGHSGQQRVDNAIAALRRNDPLPANADPQAPSLARISQELQSICERLACSPTMMVEFGEELVKLDTLAQTLRQLADRVNA